MCVIVITILFILHIVFFMLHASSVYSSWNLFLLQIDTFSLILPLRYFKELFFLYCFFPCIILYAQHTCTCGFISNLFLACFSTDAKRCVWHLNELRASFVFVCFYALFNLHCYFNSSN